MASSEIIKRTFSRASKGFKVIPKKYSSPKEACGVPLGGIGTGKIEITPDGMLRHFTTNNNYVFPIDEMPGTFIAVAYKQGDNYTVKVLSTEFFFKNRFSNVLRSEEIEYYGLYPLCMLNYKIMNSPIKIRLLAFSPVIPRDLESSSLPLIFFIFEISNTSNTTVEGSINFSWEDINGCWGSKVSWDDWVPPTDPVFSDDRGFLTTVKLTDELYGIQFSSRKHHPEVADFAWGEYTLAVKGDKEDVYIHQYNPYSSDELGRIFEILRRKGRLPNKADNRPGHYAAILGVRFRIEKGETRYIVYVLSWYTPNRWGFGSGLIEGRKATPWDYAGKKIGHWYANKYTSSIEAVSYTHLTLPTN